jgi:trans-AT polyketide synthase, acyltransferase and oxidoreductase domains
MQGIGVETIEATSVERPESRPGLASPAVSPQRMGSADFMRAHGTKLAYYAGSMYKGISSPEMVVALGKAGMLGFFGTGGLSMPRIERGIEDLKSRLRDGEPHGVNLLCDYVDQAREERVVDLCLANGVRSVEASAYVRLTPGLVRYRFSGARSLDNGDAFVPNSIIAKVSRPEVAAQFMRPAPTEIVDDLLARGALTRSEAEAALRTPIATDICIESDSAGHTDQGVASVLVPAIQDLRERILGEYAIQPSIRIGMAGGLGTPRAVAAAFVLGADFVATGSINQCTVEAGTSDLVKDLLQAAGVTETTYAPAGDMFEVGARVQVLKAKLQFPTRANKLYELYQRLESIDALDARTRTLLEEKYFGKSIDDVWSETRAYYLRTHPAELDKAERLPKHKMALIFRWYFIHTTRLTLAGEHSDQPNFQIHCGPAMGAFNLWARGTAIEHWRARRVADIGERLMNAAAVELSMHLRALSKGS